MRPLLELAGSAAIVAGTAMASIPAALIVGGFLAIAVANLVRLQPRQPAADGDKTT